MRWLVTIAIVLAALIGVAFGWYKTNFPSYTYRYRMTVNILDNDTVRSGSSVIEIKVQRQPKFGSAPPQVSRVDGEAPVVQLGNERKIIATLSGPTLNGSDYPTYIVQAAFGGPSFDERDFTSNGRIQGRKELSRDFLPVFATFVDPKDPSTFQMLSPDKFDEALGPGIKLRDVTVELTADPVTRSIEKEIPAINGPFPWLKPIGNGVAVDTRKENRWSRDHLQRKY
jgi:hypothetical protein